MKKEVRLRLSEQAFERLEEAAKYSNVESADLIEGVLSRLLHVNCLFDVIVRGRLGRTDSQLESLENEIRLIGETVVMHARHHLAVTSGLPPSPKRVANTCDGAGWAEPVEGHTERTRSVASDAIRRVNSTERDPIARDAETDLSGLSLTRDSGRDAPLQCVRDEQVTLSAAVQEDGSNSNFRYPPNAFC
jgi:hypothetical protein